MPSTANYRVPVVRWIGAIDHPDFREARELLRAGARCGDTSGCAPELVVIAQSRPGEISGRQVERIRRRWPLAGVVALLGSWCEGEYRTGRPWPGVPRLYWCEFAAWWQQQLALHDAGRCPEWSRPCGDALRATPILKPKCGIRNPHSAVVVRAADPHLGGALSDMLHGAGYAAVCESSQGRRPMIRGALAGIWDGRMLDEREAMDLARFCSMTARDGAPVIAMLDFPRRDRCEVAQQLGASAVLGKPWFNVDLVATIERLANREEAAPREVKRHAA